MWANGPNCVAAVQQLVVGGASELMLPTIATCPDQAMPASYSLLVACLVACQDNTA
jgi:hypothetical protein